MRLKKLESWMDNCIAVLQNPLSKPAEVRDPMSQDEMRAELSQLRKQRDDRVVLWQSVAAGSALAECCRSSPPQNP